MWTRESQRKANNSSVVEDAAYEDRDAPLAQAFKKDRGLFNCHIFGRLAEGIIPRFLHIDRNAGLSIVGPAVNQIELDVEGVTGRCNQNGGGMTKDLHGQ